MNLDFYQRFNDFISTTNVGKFGLVNGLEFDSLLHNTSYAIAVNDNIVAITTRNNIKNW
jgi:hypothetical protein